MPTACGTTILHFWSFSEGLHRAYVVRGSFGPPFTSHREVLYVAMFRYRHHRGVPAFHNGGLYTLSPTPNAIPARTKRQHIWIAEAKQLLLLSRSVTRAAMKEKAIICNRENTPSMTPKASPSVLVLGGDANAAQTTTTSAMLTSTVARNWKAVAASSEA